MPIKLILRLILAVAFAVVAVIFTELLPPLDGVNQIAVRILLTILSALLGFVIFPDMAAKVTHMMVSLFNMTVTRVSSEILSQLLHLPRQSHLPYSHTETPAAHPLILDTSAIIDGRILDIAKTSFLSGLILVPNFILLELQQVADSSDNLKRARGRRGFETISELKKINELKVDIWDKEVSGRTVDEKLLKLAKSFRGKIVTTDFNLNRVATAHNVSVLNVNDLANAMRVPALPGESLELKIVHIGKDPKQGVGYQPDGTMIVVENGANYLGQTITVEVSRVLQGSAGRMIFARLDTR
ncbi:hypothetical protein HY387_01615 [Candidatus Daviesbacteria bacterium]|nr:hypothetical protein [Candidatus Daviesbacteria bacterium]